MLGDEENSLFWAGGCRGYESLVMLTGKGLLSISEVRSTENGVFRSKPGFKARCLAKRFKRGRARAASVKAGRWKRSNIAGAARMFRSGVGSFDGEDFRLIGSSAAAAVCFYACSRVEN
jgi:hypothetical protein